MGNSVITHNTSSSHGAGKGKVILSNGSVQVFDKPLTVAELMLEYPQQVVVEFRPDLTQRRPSPLPADNKLDFKKVYLMLPVKRGKPASFCSEEARRVLLSANSVLRSRPLVSATGLLPFLARMCTAGAVAGEGEQSVVLLEKKAAPELVTEEILEGRPEYLSRQISGKGWKPSLDTIKEKKMEVNVKVSHWLF